MVQPRRRPPYQQNTSGLTKFDNFWGAGHPKNYQVSLVFRGQCVISNPVEEPKYRLWPLQSSDHKRYLGSMAI
jgi:hypothetical protein